jgi:hypothetical protein
MAQLQRSALASGSGPRRSLGGGGGGSRGGAINVARRGGARSSGPPRPSTVGAQRDSLSLDLC